MKERAARARKLALSYPKAVVARVMLVSRQALYCPRPRATSIHRAVPRDQVEEAIVATAQAHPTDGYRMVAALAARRLRRPVNRKKVLRVMRAHGLIQRRPELARRRRPGRFVVSRPDQLWQLDMTSIWAADVGWCYLMAIIDCYTREIVSWGLTRHCRASEAIDVVVQAVLDFGIAPSTLTLGTDNGPAFTATAFIDHLRELGISHRRGGYRDPESQAFIESWFSKLKDREVWLYEYETLTEAQAGVARYVDYYHQHPHSMVGYRTPLEVRREWRGAKKQAA